MGAVARVESTQPQVLADKNQISHHGLTASVWLTENRSAESENRYFGTTDHIICSVFCSGPKEMIYFAVFFAILLLPPFLRVSNVSVLSFNVETC